MNARQRNKQFRERYYCIGVAYEDLFPIDWFKIKKFRTLTWVKAYRNKNGYFSR